jgi:RNA polymerase sigma factor (sigma-70 family)
MSDAVNAMLQAAGRYPIPSKAEQLHLGTLIQAGLQPDASPAVKRAGARAHKRLVEGNLRLAISVAKGFRRRAAASATIDYADLIQESVIGLHMAASKFDPSRGYAFSTMATWWCRQAVGRAIAVTGSTIRIPVHQLEVTRRWKYRPEGQTLAAFCEQWGYTETRVTDILHLAYQASVRSFDAPCANGPDASSLLEQLADAQNQPDVLGIDLDWAVALLEATAPGELELVRTSLVTRTKDLATAAGISRQGMAERLTKARGKLAAIAGPAAHDLINAA